MFDTISIGSATLDVFLKSAEFVVKKDDADEEMLCSPPGTKMNVDQFALQSGGGATNTAVGFARLGLKAAVIAEVGHDTAAHVIDADLKAEGVDASLLVREKSEETGVSALLIAKDGGRSAITARGAAHMLTLDDIPFAKLKAHWIHISSVGNTDVVLAVAKHCKDHHIRFSWNPGGAELKAIQEGKLHLHEVFPTVFCVNDEEEALIVSAGYSLETAGSEIVVTEGKKGGRFFQRGKWTRFASQSTTVVQETGAGDAFVTGLAAAHLFDRQLPEAVQWGVLNAGSVVQHMGAKTGLLRRAEFPGLE